MHRFWHHNNMSLMGPDSTSNSKPPPLPCSRSPLSELLASHSLQNYRASFHSRGFDSSLPPLSPLSGAPNASVEMSTSDFTNANTVVLIRPSSPPLLSPVPAHAAITTGLPNLMARQSRGTGEAKPEEDVADHHPLNSRCITFGQGEKRSRGGDRTAASTTPRYIRSVSMDSCRSNLGGELLKPPPPPSQGSPQFTLDLGRSEFSAAELQKISTNMKLAMIASSDPKRAKRILANRLAAARSKERKTRYISELEGKVQTLQSEATTLSTQVTILQRDFFGIRSQNEELKLRVRELEQQAQLRDASNQALKVEVQRLRLSASKLNGEAQPSKYMGAAASVQTIPGSK